MILIHLTFSTKYKCVALGIWIREAKKQQDDLLDNLERYRTALFDDKTSPENRDKYRKLIQELRIKQDRVEFNYYEADRKLERFKRQNGL